METILNLPVLFFLFGMFAVFVKSSLEIPKALTDSIILYLMMAIGIKGGISLAEEGISLSTLTPTYIVIIGSIIAATYIFVLCKRFTTTATAAGIAATYGSNSTMTFITAVAFLNVLDVPYGGYMTIALVLMETPAILYGIFLASVSNGNISRGIKKALRDGTQMLLIASLVIGFVTVQVTDNSKVLYGFIFGDIFTGALCFFLLGMGLKVGHAIDNDFNENLDWRLVSVALVVPWINGALGVAAGSVAGLDVGDLYLTTLLMASASYIVAPAILSRAIPEANIGKYLTMSIGITFPMNIMIGLPVWWAIIS